MPDDTSQEKHERSTVDAGDSSAAATGSARSESSEANIKKRSTRPLSLGRFAGFHGLIALLSLSMFAAADSWNAVTGLGLASGLSFFTAVLAGITIATLIHEWFHYLGARYSGGAYAIPKKLGVFVFEWKFDQNDVQQFFMMSVAGSVGGFLAVLLIWNSIPADTLGRAALRGAAVGAFVYACIIEWPVLRRTKISREPLAELSKIDAQVLRSAAKGGIGAGLAMTLVLWN